MAMGIARVFELVEEFKVEEAKIKYVQQMRCDHYKRWYVTVCVETPRYRELWDAITQERIFQCRCCGRKFPILGLRTRQRETIGVGLARLVRHGNMKVMILMM